MTEHLLMFALGFGSGVVCMTLIAFVDGCARFTK